jgi:hypothetical protein
LVTTVAGYLAVAGTVATTISQLTIADEGSKKAGKKKAPAKN